MDIVADESRGFLAPVTMCALWMSRYFNVIGSDYKGRLGEAPRPELRAHGRISGACFDAAMGVIPELKVQTILALVFAVRKFS